MRLLIVNQYGLPAGRPGITRHGDLGAELARMGHHVTVLASRFNYLTRTAADDRAPVEVHDGVEFRWLDTGTYARNDRRRVRSMVDFTARASLAGMRLRPKPDVVLASSPHLLTGLAGIAIARRHRVPLLFEVRDLWPSVLVDLAALRPQSAMHRALVRLERLCYRTATRIITVPPHADRRVAELGIDPGKCIHIPNATTLEAERTSQPPPALQRLLDKARGRDLLVYAGAQGISNDLMTLIEAVAHLRLAAPNAYGRLAVIIVGDGSEHASLVDAVRRRELDTVQFHPPIPKDAIPPLLSRADFLLVSFADAPVYDYGLSPNKLFDYMAAARPVLLASRLDDTPVNEADAGRCYVPSSPQSLATELLALMNATLDQRQAMGDHARQLVEKRYTVQATAQQLDGLLRDVSNTA